MSTSVLLSNHRGSALEGRHARRDSVAETQKRRARRHPLSRWYICPLAALGFTRRWLVPPRRFGHGNLSLAGQLACGTVAAWCVASCKSVRRSCRRDDGARGLVLSDRADGILARRLGACDRRGAWLDANTDEIVDLGLQVERRDCRGSSRRADRTGRMIWLVLFLLGKYLLMHGLSCEWENEETGGKTQSADPAATNSGVSGLAALAVPPSRQCRQLPSSPTGRSVADMGWRYRAIGHPSPLYYNLRWLVRYAMGLKLAAEAPL